MSIEPPRCFRQPQENKHSYHLKMLERFAIKGDATPLPEHVQQVAEGMYKGDPLADAWIEYAKGLPAGQGMKMLEQALGKGIQAVTEAPEPLKTLFAHIEHIPRWLDPHLLEVGAKAYQRNSRLGISALNNVGLMGGYYASAVIKPLMYTGRLDYKADKRVSETTKFTVDVSMPGAMQRFAPGFRAAVKVRIMHAMARGMVAKADSWDEQQWGVPINQPGMLGTNLLFSYSYISCCSAMGCRFTQEERLGILHLWRYVGYLMGVDEGSLPANEQEAARTSYLIGSVQAPPDEDSRSLAQALYVVPLDRASSRWGRIKARAIMRINAGVTRFFMGKDIADQLGIPGQFTQWLIPLLFPFNYGLETARKITPGGTVLATYWGSKQRQAYVKKITGGTENPYKSVDKLKSI